MVACESDLPFSRNGLVILGFHHHHGGVVLIFVESTKEVGCEGLGEGGVEVGNVLPGPPGIYAV